MFIDKSIDQIRKNKTINKYINKYKNTKYNNFFIRTMVILIMLSIIPSLLVNATIYFQTTNSIKEQAIKTNMNMVNTTSEVGDLILKQLIQIIPQLGMDQSVQEAIFDPDVKNYERSSKIVSNLKKITSTNSLIHSIYVFSNSDKTVITSDYGVFNLHNFYDLGWVNEFDTFFKGVKQMDTRQVQNSRGDFSNCITIIGNIPYLSWGKSGAIIININEDKLHSTITGNYTKNEGEFFIINDKGYVLSHRDKTKLENNINSSGYIKDILLNESGTIIREIDGKNQILTYVTSPYNQWKYIYKMPMSSIEDKSVMVSRIIIILSIFYIIICGFLSFFIARGMYKPLERLVKQVSGTLEAPVNGKGTRGIDEYDFIGHAYSNIVNENKTMQETIDSIKPVIKEKLFINIISGKIESAQEIYERLNFVGVDLGPSNYIVLVMQIDGYNDFIKNNDETKRNLLKIQLISMIENIIRGRQNGVCFEMENDKAVAIISFDENITLFTAKEESLAIASKINEEVKSNLPFTVTIGIGRMYKNILDLNHSYDEGLTAVKYKLYQGKNIIIDIEDIGSNMEELYYYYSEKEKLLINNLKVGQPEAVKIIIDEIFIEIMENKNISLYYVQQIFTRILNSIFELIINLGTSVENVFGKDRNPYVELNEKETIEEIKIWMIKICDIIISNVSSINITKSSKYVESILQYIDDNIQNDISLNDVADHVNLTPTYVSKIFKENIGKNYIDYLNESRINKSKQLLSETKLTTKEVGFRVGFNNIQSFFRTFKRYEGITPGQYRDKNQ